MRILANDLRKAALEKHAAELAKAPEQERGRLIALIEQAIEKELRRRMKLVEPPSLLH